MPQADHDISLLLEEVERKYGREVSTSTGFESLSGAIERETGTRISTSTLKRLWGYVSSRPVPRISTLDLLSRYVGFPSFEAFRETAGNSGAWEPAFLSTPGISSSELTCGDTITVAWPPNRIVTLRYEGDDTYTVESIESAELKVGDRFRTKRFLLGFPLHIKHD